MPYRHGWLHRPPAAYPPLRSSDASHLACCCRRSCDRDKQLSNMSAPLKDAKLLKSKGGEEVAASSLWADGPVLVVVLRRPGCRE